MAHSLRPAPYRRRHTEPEVPLDEAPAGQDARLRRELIRAALITLVVGIVAAAVLMLRYIPGGNLP